MKKMYILFLLTMLLITGCSKENTSLTQFETWPFKDSYHGLVDEQGNVWYPCVTVSEGTEGLELAGTTSAGNNIYLFDEDEHLICENYGDEIMVYRSAETDDISVSYPYVICGAEFSAEDYEMIMKGIRVSGKEYAIMAIPENGNVIWGGKSSEELDEEMEGILRYRCNGYDVLHNDEGSIKIEYKDGIVSDVKAYPVEKVYNAPIRMTVTITEKENIWTIKAVNEFEANEEALITNIASFAEIIEKYTISQDQTVLDDADQLKKNENILTWTLDISDAERDDLENVIMNFLWKIRIYNNDTEPVDRIEEGTAQIVISQMD